MFTFDSKMREEFVTNTIYYSNKTLISLDIDSQFNKISDIIFI